MKSLYSLLIILLIVTQSSAQNTGTPDTTKKLIFTAIEKVPEFPGGMQGFGLYLSKNIKYPDVARLIGINGKLRLSFVVDRDGSITDVTPLNCIGAGCEAEAVKLLEQCPKWSPGVQNSKPVRVAYSIPISFTANQGKVLMQNLRKSGYGFVFNVKGTLYTIDEAEKIIGDSFMSQQVDIAEPFFNYNKITKFDMPDKKEVYLIIIKST
ncbi:energy transducer TonB [Mucilaginibacter sp. BJC16-A38]|uniref:energy transducer TonB n=1 Tax=Mucilaginibacter phenanthrenivorans TaxID=1234842 RepID=UPI002157CC05|nr:energy transducer TonB [Mucilaginibacter phenanthrenivorans]MCR8561719.1 energy transducer TonB [Mucilaginibacter phenanthrenivorans]